MKQTTIRSLFFTALVATILVSAPANSQRRLMTEILPKELTTEDIELMKETARSKMETEPVETVIKWKNPDSGNTGAVKLLRRFQLSDRECMTNRHYILFNSGEKRVYEFTVCREEGGDWVLDS